MQLLPFNVTSFSSSRLILLSISSLRYDINLLQAPFIILNIFSIRARLLCELFLIICFMCSVIRYLFLKAFQILVCFPRIDHVNSNVLSTVLNGRSRQAPPFTFLFGALFLFSSVRGHACSPTAALNLLSHQQQSHRRLYVPSPEVLFPCVPYSDI